MNLLEREALIDRLNAQECCQSHGGVGAHPGRCDDCPRSVADMLSADARENARLLRIAQDETARCQRLTLEVDVLRAERRRMLDLIADAMRIKSEPEF